MAALQRMPYLLAPPCPERYFFGGSFRGILRSARLALSSARFRKSSLTFSIKAFVLGTSLKAEPAT